MISSRAGAGTTDSFRILLVEDDPECGTAMRIMFERRGHLVVLVPGAPEAIEAFDPDEFDVAIVDIRLDSFATGSGIDVLEHVRAVASDFPVVLISAYSDIEPILRAVELHAQSYVPKPMTSIDDVLQHVRKVVRDHRLIKGALESQDSLRRNEEKLRNILQSMEDIVFVLDRNGCFTAHCSHDLKALFGAADGFVGRHFKEVLPRPMNEHLAPEFEKTRNGTKAECECILKMGSNEICWHAKLSPIFADGEFDGAVVVTRDITELRQTETRLRELTSQVELAEEHERRRMAIEIHDAIGHNLTTSHLRLDSALEEGISRKSTKDLRETNALLKDSIHQMQSLLFELAPPVLYEMGLEPALQALVSRAAETHKLAVEFYDDGEKKPIEEDKRSLLYRTVRELMHNTVKHTRARNVGLAVCRRANELHIEFENDGIGFDPDKNESTRKPGGLGLFSIRQRVKMLGGSFRIVSKAGVKGTRIIVSVPLDEKGVGKRRADT